MTTIKCNEFVKRQTAESKFSHFEGSWEQLEELVLKNFDNKKQGYTEGVWLVTVPTKGFYSGFVKLTPETELFTKFAPRQEGENAYVQITAKGTKAPAKYVEIAVYSRATLQKNHEETTDADFEIVNIGASPTEVPTPMDPVTMARNYFNLPGGTKMEFTEEMAKTMTREQWLEQALENALTGALFYSQHAHVQK